MNNKGEILKDRLDSLSALDAGIVYSRETSWDKLADKMEQKKKHVIWPYYTGMAAALLIVIVFLKINLQQQKNQIPVVQTQSGTKQPTNPASAIIETFQNQANEAREVNDAHIKTASSNTKKSVSSPKAALNGSDVNSNIGFEEPIINCALPIKENFPPAPEEPKFSMRLKHIDHLNDTPISSQWQTPKAGNVRYNSNWVVHTNVLKEQEENEAFKPRKENNSFFNFVSAHNKHAAQQEEESNTNNNLSFQILQIK